MAYSLPRKVSSFVGDDDSDIYVTKPQRSRKFENEHFGFTQYSNLIGDSIHVQDCPRAVSVSETGEKHTLGSDEVAEIVDGKQVSEKIDHQEPRRKRRSKSATNSSTRLRPSFTPRILCSVPSQEQLHKSQSTCSNIGTQTRPKSRRVSFSIPLELPSPQPNQKAYGNRAQPLSHKVTPIPSTVTISEAKTQASFKDFWNIFALLSMLVILLWIASDYLELNGVREYMVNKLRGVDVKSDPPKSKYEIVQEFITKLLT